MICFSFFLIKKKQKIKEKQMLSRLWRDRLLFFRANAHEQSDSLKYHFVIEVKG
jgi:hypothetical protein